MLVQQIYDPAKLPSAVWQLFFNQVELFFNNNPVKYQTVNLKSGGAIKRVIIGSYTYLEQNPHSSSQYGIMARNGHKIIWIIHFPTGRYVGKVVDGRVTKI
jgi:hypothetical protein